MAATSGSVQGNIVGLYVDSTSSPAAAAGGTWTPATANWDLIGATTNASFSISNASYETNFKTTNAGAAGIGSSSRSYGIGSQSGSLSLEGVVQMDATYGLEYLTGLAINKTKVGVVWGTNNGDDMQITGTGFITSIEASAGVNDFTTFSCTIELDGDASKNNAA
jgi:hypothetical protein